MEDFFNKQLATTCPHCGRFDRFKIRAEAGGLFHFICHFCIKYFTRGTYEEDFWADGSPKNSEGKKTL